MKTSVARGAIFTVLLALFPAMTACSPGAPEDVPAAELEAGSVLLMDAGILRLSKHVCVFGKGDAPLTEGFYEGSRRSTVLLGGLPADWEWIGFYRKAYWVLGPPVVTGRVVRGTGLASAPAPPAEPLPWPLWLMLGFFVLFSVYGVVITGVSGGPNHGEHPFILNIGFLMAWIVISPLWPAPFGKIFIGLLLAGLGISIPVMGIRVWSHPKTTWVARIAYGLIYACMFAVMVWPKPPAAAGEWTGSTTVVLHASESMSDLAMIGESGEVIYQTSAAGRHALLLAVIDAPGVSVRVSFAERGSAGVELPDRPEE